MALEPGGYADKLGNRYEGRWVVKQLLRVLNEQLLSVTVEAVGDDEAGVDLWVKEVSGRQTAQQCKLRNGSSNQWTIADLSRVGVLRYIQQQLDRNTETVFSLVTAIPSTLLHDICNSARDSSGDSESFYQHQIVGISKERKKVFTDFCGYLSLDPDSLDDRAIAYSYLPRIFIEHWPDTLSSQSDLRADAQWLVNGDSDSVIANLSDYAESHIRKTINSEYIWRFLTEKGFSPRKLPNDSRIAPSIQELREQFDESISSHLIAGHLIPRDEIKKVLDALESEGIVVLHGRPGYGKSGVLYEITRHFENDAQIYLPLRLDRQEPHNTTQQFGQDLGLPESPVKCLDAISDGKACTLILDQLDAIRWTNVHSKNALEVCKSLVREVMRLRAIGRPISVILACRTYDLENDPDIKTWIRQTTESGKRLSKVEVGPLSDDVVISIASKVGVASLSDRQISILKSPQHMAMWVNLIEDGQHVEFRNRVQLMRKYWDFRIQELVKSGLSVEVVDSEITRIVEYMELKSSISAPYSINRNVPVIKELCACGMIQVVSNRITFSHQCYLDYQIANNLLREIFSGSKGICDWLGEKNSQTLFRREQLRQVLSLLSEESPEEFFSEVNKILSSKNTRFNLKHLTLEVVSQVETPDTELLKYMLELSEERFWKEHIFGIVFLGHPAYINWLIDTNHLKQWLEDDQRRKSTLWLLRSVSNMIPDQVSELLLPYLGDEAWHDHILECLSWNVHDDSENMFQIRIQLAMQGVLREYVEWKKVSSERCIKLLEAILQSYKPEDIAYGNHLHNGHKPSRLENWSADDLEVLLKASRERAHDVWKRILPQLIRLSPDKNDTYHSKDLWIDSDSEELRSGRERLPNGILKVCIAAGEELAKKDYISFWTATESLRKEDSCAIRYALVTIYTSFDSSQADNVLRWLMSDIPNFIVGTGYLEPKWMPVARIIEALSPYCSDALFRELECKIIHYKDENLLNNAEYWLSTSKKGHFGAYWGHAQYFLLPALFSNRRSKKANELITVLNRKFESYDKTDFVSGLRTRGGIVSSTISGDRLNKISDRAWLGIIENKDIPDYGNFNWEKGMTETSVRYLSSDLECIAKRFPNRFAHLALKFPKDTSPKYKSAILEALKETEPKSIPEDELADWKPVNHELVLLVLNKFSSESADSFPLKFCWLLYRRPEGNWPEQVVDKLMNYATSHCDPEPKKLNIGNADRNFDSEKSTVRNLESNAINCVRGVAAMALGQLLWFHSELLYKVKTTLKHLVEDEHPAVRIASLEAALPLVNLDKDYAVNLFTIAVQADLRVAASRQATQFFNCCMKSHFDQLQPIVMSMLKSPWDEVVEHGAQEVTARWLFHGFFSNEVEVCVSGNENQRKGVAQIAAHFIEEASYFEQCKILIDRLKNDKNKEVRKKLTSVVRKSELFTSSQSIEFLVGFTDSLAFGDDPTFLLYQLEDYSGDLLPFANLLLAIGDHFINPRSGKIENGSTEASLDTYHYMPLMIRLYEQAKDSSRSDIENKCLDIWDGMFEKRVGSINEISKVID